MSPHSAHDAIAVLDFGSQYAQLIVRRIREAGVYAELFPWDADPAEVLALRPKGFVLSGGPASVYEPGAPSLPPYVLESGRPVLGICYGMQLLAHALGGRVAPAPAREYGRAEVEILEPEDPLWRGLPSPMAVWMSHGDRVEALPPGFRAMARSPNAPLRGHRRSGPPPLRRAVPPRGRPHAPGPGAAAPLRGGAVRLSAHLDPWGDRRGADRADPGAGGRGTRALRGLRGRGLHGDCGAGPPGGGRASPVPLRGHRAAAQGGRGGGGGRPCGPWGCRWPP
jgi:GMP synthase (glutamine-hydrolysing) A subunit